MLGGKPMQTEAKNTLWFKAFNADYRSGGVFNKLDTSEFRTMIILQSYADSKGDVINSTGVGYNFYELTQMVNLNYRTTKRSLMALVSKGLIMVSDDMVIHLIQFVNDQAYREVSKKGSYARRQMAAKQERTLQNTEKIITKLDTTGLFNKETGEIVK